MKKSILITIVAMVIITTATSHAQIVFFGKNDLEQENLKGNVSRVVEYQMIKNDYMSVDEWNEYKRKGQKPPEFKRSLSSIKEYDIYGYLAKDSSSFDELKTYTYIKPGYVKEEKIVWSTDYFAQQGTPPEVYVYSFEYDEDMNLVKSVKTHNGLPLFTENYTTSYSDGIKSLECRHISNEDNSVRTTVITYHPNGKIRSFEESSHGVKTRSLIFNNNGDLIRIDTYGLMASSSILDYTDSRMTVTTINNGQRYISLTRDLDKYGNYFNEISYDANGNTTNTITCKYKYDSHGNWIRCEKINSDPTGSSYTLERDISYY